VRIVAVLNQKGGVGKTPSVANLGAAMAARGHDVCLVDLDPQSHLTLHMGLEPGASALSMYDVLTSEAEIANAAVKVRDHLWVVPSVIDLAAAEVELVSIVGREQILRDRFRAVGLPFEFVIVDCPPSLGLLTLNALAAADEVLIPLQPHFLALQGLGKLLETVSLVQRRINPGLTVSGVLLCMYETGTRLAGEVLADLQSFLDSSRGQPVPWAKARVFQTVIRRNVKLAECPSHGKTIFEYEPTAHGAQDYLAMAEEFLLLCGPRPGENARAEGVVPEAQAEDSAPAANPPGAEDAARFPVPSAQADVASDVAERGLDGPAGEDSAGC
jgi:chromosome partitioning protein